MLAIMNTLWGVPLQGDLSQLDWEAMPQGTGDGKEFLAFQKDLEG